MNEKIYCRIRRVRAVLLTFFLTAAVVLTDAQNIREKEYEKTEIIYCIGDSITYGSGLEDEDRLTKSYPAQLGIRLGPRYLIFNYGVRGATLQDLSRKSYRNMGYLNVIYYLTLKIHNLHCILNFLHSYQFLPKPYKCRHHHLLR